MEDIPEDLMSVASAIAADIPSRVNGTTRGFAANVIARAILAERNRCAAYVAEHQTIIAGEPADPIMEEILHAMLKGPPQ